MGDFDPVSWETHEAALGSPAREVTSMVDQMQGEVYEKDPYEAVKTIHDALSTTDKQRTVPNVGESFITAYLLENNGIIAPDPDETGNEYRSLVERRFSSDKLRELFWEKERTLWWIGVLAGVHPSLVTYWFYEDDIPLMERNYAAESMAQIRSYRSTENAE